MRQSQDDSQLKVCCNQVLTPKNVLLESAPGFVGWAGIIRGLTNLFDKGETYIVTCWECPKCGSYMQSGIKKVAADDVEENTTSVKFSKFI